MEVFLQQPNGGWQLADIPKPLNEVKPEKSKFLGMYDQKVPQETVARSRPPSAGKAGQAREEGKGEKSTPREKVAKPKKIPEFGKDVYSMKSPVTEKQEKNEVSKGAPLGSMASVPEDYYPDYKIDDHTYVNVLRYPDVEYFVRLKRIFKTTWNPIQALRQDMQGNSVSRGEVSVVLAVSVDKSGNLSELFVLKSSGLGNYDSEAIRTIRASSPFSAPPEKFLDKKDQVLRMSWTFVVYL